MAQVIARIYPSAEKAGAAAAAAKALGYGDSEVFVSNPSTGATQADYSGGLAQAGLGKDEADACSDELAKGRSVVVVHAPFGGGAKATAALDKFDPVGAPPTKFTNPAKAKPAGTRESPSTGTDATPLSNALGWSTLLNSPTPFSDYFKLPVLTPFTSKVQVTNGTTTKVDLISGTTTKVQLTSGTTTKVELIDDPAPLSRKLGWRLLIDDPAPLSHKLNWPILKN